MLLVKGSSRYNISTHPVRHDSLRGILCVALEATRGLRPLIVSDSMCAFIRQLLPTLIGRSSVSVFDLLGLYPFTIQLYVKIMISTASAYVIVSDRDVNA